MRVVLIILTFWLLVIVAAFAQPNVKGGAWHDASDEEKLWLQEQVNPHNTSCCGLGDAITVEITGGTDSLVFLRVLDGKGHITDGTPLSASRSLIIPGRNGPNPFGVTIAWVSSQGYVYCVAPVWET